MKVLVIASKCPLPTIDGGRLALWHTVLALHRAGHRVRVLAPITTEDTTLANALVQSASPWCDLHLVTVAKTKLWQQMVRSLLRNLPLTIVRHQDLALQEAVAEAVATWQPDVIHAEQLQAFANVQLQSEDCPPVVLRMQNVESELWRQTAKKRGFQWAFQLEAWRLRRFETNALRKASRVIAISALDAEMFRACLAVEEQKKVHTWLPPFPSDLPNAPALPGAPALVLAGSAGWWPNADACHWFLHAVLPVLLQRLPKAQIHVFGEVQIQHPNVVSHPNPADSIAVFPFGSITVIPLRVGSGIRMRILESWARGVVVVATTRAAMGLAPGFERALKVGDSPSELVDAIATLHHNQAQQRELISAGRQQLIAAHDSTVQGKALEAIYRDAIERQQSTQQVTDH